MTEGNDKVQWAIQFFFKTPTQFPLLEADDLRIATITKSAWARILELREKLTSLKRFLEDKDKHYVFLASLRVEATTAHKAIFQAFRRLDSYFDSVAVAGFTIPAVSTVTIVRKGREPDAQVMEFHRNKWLEGRPKTPTDREAWTARSNSIMQHMLPIISQLIEKPPENHNDLAWRALHSAKLFRRGVEAKSFGIEFLCKFAALENLVAGGKRNEKRKTFCSRLGSLVRDVLPDSESAIVELWNRRHPLVHEARVEFMDEDPEGFPVHIHMETLNWLVQVTFVFLSDSFKTASSLKELWELADSYQIPENVATSRPSTLGRFPASTWAEKPGIVWTGAGTLVDALWAAPPEQTK